MGNTSIMRRPTQGTHELEHAQGEAVARGGLSGQRTSFMWIVVYAKIVDDKENGIRLAGVHFGGTADDKPGAEKVARDCVNTIKGGTIMPRLYQSQGYCDLPRIMQDAEVIFKKKEQEMVMTAAILSRPTKRK